MGNRKIMMPKKIQTNINIPSEILNEIIMFTDITTIKSILPYSKIYQCLDQSLEIWNNYCKSSKLQISECKNLLKNKYKILKAVSNKEEVVRNIKTLQSDMTQLSICKNRIYCSSDDQTLKVFDFNGNLLKKFIGHSGGIWAFETDGEYLITGSTDKTARIWNAESETTERVLKSHRSTIRTLKYYNKYIITGSRDHMIIVWNNLGDLLHVLESHTQSVRCMDVSDDYLVSGSYDCTVKLWDYKRGKFLKDLNIHRKRVYVVKIYKNYVASSGLDSEVKICSIDGLYNHSYTFHSSIVAWLDFQDNFIVSSGSDGSIVKFNYIDKKLDYVIQESSPIKSQKIFNGLLIVGTMTEVKVYSFNTGRFIRKLLSAYMITKVEMVDWKIVIGFYMDGDYQISIFDYEHCK